MGYLGSLSQKGLGKIFSKCGFLNLLSPLGLRIPSFALLPAKKLKNFPRGCESRIFLLEEPALSHSVLLWDLLISKIYRDMRPPAKLSYRSAIHKKVVFGAGDAWTLPQIQGEVGGDQEPPGNTWRYPMGSKFFLLVLNHI